MVSLLGLSPNIFAKTLPLSPIKSLKNGSPILGIREASTILIISASTGSDARKPMPVKNLLFVIPFVVTTMSAIKSVTALSLNYATSTKLLLSVTAVINFVINAPSPSNTSTMSKLHIACILNGSFQRGRAFV